MRTSFLVLALSAVALSASCILPEATREPSGGDTSTGGSGNEAPFVTYPITIHDSSGDNVVAPSGNPGQHHLIRARGGWYAFHFRAEGLAVRISPNFRGWDDNRGTAADKAFLSLFLNDTPVDGRMFAVGTRDVDGVDVVHLSLTSPFAESPFKYHERARIVPSLTPLQPVHFDASLPTPLPGIVPPELGITTATGISRSPPYEVVDFTGLAGETEMDEPRAACAIEFAKADTGVGWSPDPTAVTDIALHPQSYADDRFVLGLRDGVSMVWAGISGLAVAKRGPEGIGKAKIVSESLPGSRSFAACMEPREGDEPDAGHLLYWTTFEGFRHLTTSDGETWHRLESAPAPFDNPLTELFLACGDHEVRAFSIDEARSGNTILSARWLPDTGWDKWYPVVYADASPTRRCFLTGHDQIIPGEGVGLMWTATNNCVSDFQVELRGALVASVGK